MFILLEISRPVARQMERLEDAMRRVDELVVQGRPGRNQRVARALRREGGFEIFRQGQDRQRRVGLGRGL